MNFKSTFPSIWNAGLHFEMWMKESGAEHFAAAWEGPGQARQLFTESYLEPPKEGKDC